MSRRCPWMQDGHLEQPFRPAAWGEPSCQSAMAAVHRPVMLATHCLPWAVASNTQGRPWGMDAGTDQQRPFGRVLIGPDPPQGYTLDCSRHLPSPRTFFVGVGQELNSVSDSQLPPANGPCRNTTSQHNPRCRQLGRSDLPSAPCLSISPTRPTRASSRGVTTSQSAPPTPESSPQSSRRPLADESIATTLKMAPSCATSMPAGPSPRPFRLLLAPTAATRSSSTTSRR